MMVSRDRDQGGPPYARCLVLTCQEIAIAGQQPSGQLRESWRAAIGYRSGPPNYEVFHGLGLDLDHDVHAWPPNLLSDQPGVDKSSVPRRETVPGLGGVRGPDSGGSRTKVHILLRSEIIGLTRLSVGGS